MTATAIVTSGCTIDRSTRSDGEGPTIEVTFSGGVALSIKDETPRGAPADNCAIVRDAAGGSVTTRSVDLLVLVADQSGMNSFRLMVEGDGIRRASIKMDPKPNPILAFTDTRDVDEIALTFLVAQQSCSGHLYLLIRWRCSEALFTIAGRL